MSLNAKSHYDSQFGAKKTNNLEMVRKTDNLKSGGLWMGASSYQQGYQGYSNEDYKNSNFSKSQSEKRLKVADYSSRFGTLIYI